MVVRIRKAGQINLSYKGVLQASLHSGTQTDFFFDVFFFFKSVSSDMGLLFSVRFKAVKAGDNPILKLLTAFTKERRLTLHYRHTLH